MLVYFVSCEKGKDSQRFGEVECCFRHLLEDINLQAYIPPKQFGTSNTLVCGAAVCYNLNVFD